MTSNKYLLIVMLLCQLCSRVWGQPLPPGSLNRQALFGCGSNSVGTGSTYWIPNGSRSAVSATQTNYYGWVAPVDMLVTGLICGSQDPGVAKTRTIAVIAGTGTPGATGVLFQFSSGQYQGVFFPDNPVLVPVSSRMQMKSTPASTPDVASPCCLVFVQFIGAGGGTP